jgi:putative acetyltransferase
MQIRAEVEKDWLAVKAVNGLAFNRSAEADLVAELREKARPVISLVAEDRGGIVGHIMFSPVLLADHAELKIMGLAPMAVSPEHQRKGIGSTLMRAGLEECKNLGFGAIVVVGHPEYYARFGFTPAVLFALSCEFDVPEEVFMALELQTGYLDGASGEVQYHPAFKNV